MKIKLDLVNWVNCISTYVKMITYDTHWGTEVNITFSLE